MKVGGASGWNGVAKHPTNHSRTHHHGRRYHLARDIAWVGQVGDEIIGLRLKSWIDAVFCLARSLGDLAAGTVKRKQRDLDNRIADIVCTATECEQTRKVLRKIDNARDQLMTFLDAPDL